MNLSNNFKNDLLNLSIPSYIRKRLKSSIEFDKILNKLAFLRKNRPFLSNSDFKDIVILLPNKFSNRFKNKILSLNKISKKNKEKEKKHISLTNISFLFNEKDMGKFEYKYSYVNHNYSFVDFIPFLSKQLENLNNNLKDTLVEHFNKLNLILNDNNDIHDIVNVVYEKNKLVSFDGFDCSSFEFNEQVNNKDNIYLPIFINLDGKLNVDLIFDEDEFYDLENHSFYSGFIGYIYVKKTDIRNKYKVKRITSELQEKVKHLMKTSFMIYN